MTLNNKSSNSLPVSLSPRHPVNLNQQIKYLTAYPFSDLSDSKVRPAIVVNTRHISQDILIVPITSKTSSLLSGEFVLVDWQAARLNVPSAVKRGIYTIDQKLVIKIIGKLQKLDAQKLDFALKSWLGLSD